MGAAGGGWGAGGGREGRRRKGGAKSVHGQKAVHVGAVPVAENHSRSAYWFPLASTVGRPTTADKI